MNPTRKSLTQIRDKLEPETIKVNPRQIRSAMKKINVKPNSRSGRILVKLRYPTRCETTPYSNNNKNNNHKTVNGNYDFGVEMHSKEFIPLGMKIRASEIFLRVRIKFLVDFK